MEQFHWLPLIDPETIFTLVCLGFVLILWISWAIISSTDLADKFHTMHWEELLWRKHGVSVSGLFFSIIVVVLVLYSVWVFLGEL
jgi:hypothetical protein